MPNNITNELTAPKHVIDSLAGKNGAVDFNAVIPMPPRVAATFGESGLHPAWYDWSIKHWGTKWNAYEIERASDTCARFQTAWSMPEEVIEALAAKFPTETIQVRWADENFGYNAGIRVYQGGGVVDSSPAPGSREAKDLALELLYGGKIPEDMRRNEAGELVHVE